MTHYMRLKNSPFLLIKNQKKTIELRLNDDKRRAIKIDDYILFSNVDALEETILTKVIALYKFKTFKDLYASLPLVKCGYLPDELKTASPDDMLEYYSATDQEKHGVLGIEIELIQNI